MRQAFALFMLVLAAVAVLAAVILPGVLSVGGLLAALPLFGVALNIPKSVKGSSSGQENRKAKESRMRSFWDKTPVIYSLGCLLAATVDGKRIADVVAMGGKVNLTDKVEVDGKTLVLVKPLVLALSTLADWGCPACHSAHGSNEGPSKKKDSSPDADALAANEFYYDPQAKRIFTISRSCYQDYVVGLAAKSKIHDLASCKLAAAKAS